jgi:hypothetical protein
LNLDPISNELLHMTRTKRRSAFPLVVNLLGISCLSEEEKGANFSGLRVVRGWSSEWWLRCGFFARSGEGSSKHVQRLNESRSWCRTSLTIPMTLSPRRRAADILSQSWLPRRKTKAPLAGMRVPSTPLCDYSDPRRFWPKKCCFRNA